MQESTTTQEKINKGKEDFNIVVTYAENGQSFQSIAENIIIRKMNENKWNFFSTLNTKNNVVKI